MVLLIKVLLIQKKRVKETWKNFIRPLKGINKSMAKGVILMTFSNQEVILDKMTNQRIHNDIDQNIQLTFKYYIPVFEIW